MNRTLDHALVMEHITPVRSKPKPAPKPKKPNNPKIDKAAILHRRYPDIIAMSAIWCDCGCWQDGHDLHHAFIGRKAGHPELDDERNLVLVNHDEHIARRFDNQEWRKKFWQVQLRRYGKVKMMEWVNSLSPKMRSRIDWL